MYKYEDIILSMWVVHVTFYNLTLAIICVITYLSTYANVISQLLCLIFLLIFKGFESCPGVIWLGRGIKNGYQKKYKVYQVLFFLIYNNVYGIFCQKYVWP